MDYINIHIIYVRTYLLTLNIWIKCLKENLSRKSGFIKIVISVGKTLSLTARDFWKKICWMYIHTVCIFSISVCSSARQDGVDIKVYIILRSCTCRMCVCYLEVRYLPWWLLYGVI